MSERIVTRLPLTDLWDSTGTLVRATNVRPLDAEHIRDLLRGGPVHFVVANVGSGLAWLDDARHFDFWKREVQSHLYQPDKPRLKDYPDRYFYFASEWHLDSSDIVVVLEMQH